jgi:hypothetical protein
MGGYGNQPVKHRKIVTDGDAFLATSRLRKDLLIGIFFSLTMPD